jgi:ribosomal protein L14
MEIPGPTNEGGIVSGGNIQATQNPQAQQNFEKKPYQFGDFTRGVVARGKRASRREEGSSYQFGDFTRGLFS